LTWPGYSWKDITVSVQESEKVTPRGVEKRTVITKEKPGVQPLLLSFFHDIYMLVYLCG
jgi:hypothetical protein